MITNTSEIELLQDILWPIPKEYHLDLPHVDQRDEYAAFLKQKLGALHEEYERLCTSSHDDNWQGYIALNEFIFANNLQWIIQPSTTNRARQTFSALHELFQNEPAGITVVDLGTGDGTTAIALAATCDSVQRVYAVDSCESALAHVPRVLERLPRHLAALAQEKVIPVSADYRKNEDMTALRGRNGTIDAVIGLFQPDFFELMSGTALLQDNMRLLFGIPQHRSVTKYMMTSTLNGVVSTYGARSAVKAIMNYAPDERVFINEITS